MWCSPAFGKCVCVCALLCLVSCRLAACLEAHSNTAHANTNKRNHKQQQHHALPPHRLTHYLADKRRSEKAALEMAGKLTQQLQVGCGWAWNKTEVWLW